MIPLSTYALEYAVNLCCNKEYYYVGIACAEEYEQKTVSDILRRIFREKNLSPTCNRYAFSCNTTYYFENKSRIHILPIGDSARGYRIHLLIMDEKISSKDMQTLYMAKEIEYINEWWVLKNMEYTLDFYNDILKNGTLKE